MAIDAEMDERMRKYRKRRNVELHALNVELSVQNYVDLKAMAAGKGQSMGEFLDRMIERRVERRQARMEAA